MPVLEDQYIYILVFKYDIESNTFHSGYFLRDFASSRILKLGGRCEPIENSGEIKTEADLIEGLHSGEIKYQDDFFLGLEHTHTLKSSLKDAEYHPRIFWQTVASDEIDFGGLPPFDQSALIDSLRRTKLLWAELERVLEVVAPNVENFAAFGDTIRRAIIMTCAEIETEFFAILKENNYPNDRPNISDFMKVDRFTSLSIQTVEFLDFPSIPAMEPFHSFSEQKAPYWWNNYNKLKHEMPDSISKANIETLFSAFAGLICLLASEYGGAFTRATQHFRAGDVFKISTKPNKLEEMRYFISGRKDWTPISLPW